MRSPESPVVEQLLDAVTRFDEGDITSIFSAGSRSAPLVDWLGGTTLPLLQAVGDAWEAGTLSVAHEHFVSQLVRRHLAAIVPVAPGTVGAPAPSAVLACPPGERHDLALQAFGLLLVEAGWRVTFLGQDTPMPSLAMTCRALDPDLVIVAATRRTAMEAHSTSLRRLAAERRLAIAGRGAAPDFAALVGAELLPGDLGAALAVLARAPALTA